MAKWIISIIITLTILILAITLLIITPLGLKARLRIAKKIIPGEFTYSTVCSFANGPLVFTNFTYQHNGLSIIIDKLEIGWKPLFLLKAQLSISDLKAQNTRIILSSQSQNEKIRNPLKQQLPINLYMQNCNFSNLTIQRRENSSPIYLKNLWIHKVAINNSLIATIDGQMIQPFPLNLHLVFSGTLNNYHITLRAKNRDIDWLITSKGTQEWIETQIHEAHTLNGRLNALIKIQLEPTLCWQIDVNIIQLDLQRLYKKWPHQLTFQLKTKGFYTNRTSLIPNFIITGKLQSQKAYIHITGQHHQRWDLNWTANIKDFSSLFTTVHGALWGHGTITGPFNSPLMRGELKGHNISFPNIKIDKLEGHWNIDSLFNQTFTFQLKAKKIQIIIFQLSQSQLKINIRRHLHALQIETKILINDKSFGKFVINLGGRGNIQNNIWNGSFYRVNIQSQKFGDWNISQSIKTIIGKNQTIITPIYLHSGKNYLRLQGQWHAKSVSIQGKLINNFDDWSLARTILPDIIQPHGRLIASLNISGFLTQPTIRGTITLRHGSIDFPELRVSLTRAHASINITRLIIHYHLESYFQNQPVQLVGQTQLNMPGYPTTLSLHGVNLLIINTHQYMIYGSPNLKISIEGRDVNITGMLVIPRAILKPTTFSRSTTLTGDATFVGPKAKKRPLWKINLNIQVILLRGRVFINSLGAKGRLGGQFMLSKTVPQPLIANGRITIIDGIFTTHGRKLDVTPHSSIIFIQSPVTNPILNIRAVRTLKLSPIIAQPSRTIEEGVDMNNIVTVGFDIEGTLRHPDVDLYASDPNLTQSDILSYLIFGHPANANNMLGNMNLLADAIEILNTKGRTSIREIINQITQWLGLTELGIEYQTTPTTLEAPIILSHTQENFVVGRYLLPHLYVRYSRGITIPINIVQLQYLISKNWAIQTEASSLGNMVAVLYSIEQN